MILELPGVTRVVSTFVVEVVRKRFKRQQGCGGSLGDVTGRFTSTCMLYHTAVDCELGGHGGSNDKYISFFKGKS